MAAMALPSRDICFKHRSRTRTTNWGDVETLQLIELWQSFRYELQQTKKRRPIFEQMSRMMHGFGFRRDANEIQGRITNLAYLYRDTSYRYYKDDCSYEIVFAEVSNAEARRIPSDTTLTVVNLPLPDISIVKVENASVPESTSAGDGRKSSPGESTSTSSWMDQSGNSGAINGNHSEEEDDESDSFPYAEVPCDCSCDIVKTVVEQQRLMALQILNEEEMRHEERVRIVLDMENRLKQEHNNFKLALIDRLNKGFTQILMAVKSSTAPS